MSRNPQLFASGRMPMATAQLASLPSAIATQGKFAMSSVARLITQFKALNSDGSYGQAGEKTLQEDMARLRDDLAALKPLSAEHFATASAMLEDAIALFRPAQLHRLTLFLEGNHDTSVQIPGWGNEFRNLSLFKDEAGGSNLHTVIGKGIGRNLAAQVLAEAAQANGEEDIAAAYELVADASARNCPGLSAHIIANVLLFEHQGAPGESRPALDQELLSAHPLNAHVELGNAASPEAAQRHVIHLARQKLKDSQASA